MSFSVSRILLAACSAGLSLHAAAQVVVPLDSRAYNAVSINDAPQFAQKLGTDLSSNISVSGWGSVATAISDPRTPSVFSSLVSTFDPARDYVIADAVSFIDYDYTVIGATGPVPVDFDYALEVANTGFGGAIAELTVTNNYPYEDPVIEIGLNTQSYAAASGTHWLTGTATADATVGQVDQVLLYTTDETAPGESATAFVDPRIYIDPAYLAANPGVSLEISDGIGNLGPAGVSAVPEPANLVLLLAGLSLFAIPRRRHA